MRNKKDRVVSDVKAEYIKRMKSPAYVKQVKRTMQILETFNLLYCNDRIKKHEMRSIAHYFAEDIKNPIMKPNQIIESNDKAEEVLTDSLLIS